MTGSNIENVELQGIIPRMIRTVFKRIDTGSDAIEFSVKVSMIEIYMEKIRDLLDITKDNLKVHEDKNKGVYMPDLTEHYISEER
jgi:kinesin family protein 5